MIICSLLLFTSFFGGNQTNNLDRVKDMGLGLTNEYIVSQYGGTMKISAKDSVYLLEIRLNIPEKAEKTKGN